MSQLSEQEVAEELRKWTKELNRVMDRARDLGMEVYMSAVSPGQTGHRHMDVNIPATPRITINSIKQTKVF